MPLLFNSLSHGEVPFGFFNIETDMLLLGNCFFFADDFSSCICELAIEEAGESQKVALNVYRLNEESIGNLMGAISGVHLSGFIGEVYNHFPFPYEPEKFKQNPEGYRNRELIESIVKRYAVLSAIRVVSEELIQTAAIGEYQFSRHDFHQLLSYLWVGGYPRWKQGVRPDYVLKMRERIMHSANPLFNGVIAQFDNA